MIASSSTCVPIARASRASSKRIEKKVEWGLRLTWDEKAAREKVDRKHASKPRGADLSGPRGADYLARKRDVLDVSRKGLVEARAAADRVYKAMGRQATASQRRTSMERAAPGSRLLLDAAFLVPVARSSAFRVRDPSTCARAADDGRGGDADRPLACVQLHSMSPRNKPPRRSKAEEILGPEDASLLDIVDNLLNKGVVLSGDITIALANVDLVYARLSLLLSAADRVLPGEQTDYIERHTRGASCGRLADGRVHDHLRLRIGLPGADAFKADRDRRREAPCDHS